MKYYLPVLLLLFALPAFGQSKAQVRQNRAVAEREQIEKLEKAWYRFADALLRRDTAGLNALATACIKCTNCPANISSGSSTPINDGPDSTRLLSFNEFLVVCGPYIFDDNTIARLKDPAKLRFIDNEYNAAYYTAPCIVASSGLKLPQHKEVLLTFADPSSAYEGAQHAFAFIETKEGYKFCGYSTIP